MLAFQLVIVASAFLRAPKLAGKDVELVEKVQSPEVEAEPVHMQAAGEQFMQPWRQVRQTHTHKWQSGQRHA